MVTLTFPHLGRRRPPTDDPTRNHEPGVLKRSVRDSKVEEEGIYRQTEAQEPLVKILKTISGGRDLPFPAPGLRDQATLDHWKRGPG